MNNIDIATIIVIVINVLVSMKGFSDKTFFNQYKFQISPIQQGEKHRMFSSGFLHADQQHLFFNMLTLYFFAQYVVVGMGRINFIIIYLASLLAGSLLAMLFHKKEPFYSAVGASGAVMGVLYAAVMLYPSIQIYFVPGYIFAVGYLIYSVYGMKNSVGNIGHSAHLGGAIAGYVLTIVLHPSVIQTNPKMLIGMGMPIVLMFIFKDKLLAK